MSAFGKECIEHGCICATCVHRQSGLDFCKSGCTDCLSIDVPLDFEEQNGYNLDYGGLSKCDYYKVRE